MADKKGQYYINKRWGISNQKFGVIKNGKSRETGTIVYTRQRKAK
jgi:hypothetical protein